MAGGNQLAIYKRIRGAELETTVKQLQIVVRTGLDPQPSDFKTSGTLTTRPRCLPPLQAATNMTTHRILIKGFTRNISLYKNKITLHLF